MGDVDERSLFMLTGTRGKKGKNDVHVSDLGH